MIPSLQSLATVAILKSPETSKATFDTLSQATGHFRHLSVLFVFEGNTFRTFLRRFCLLQNSTNFVILQETLAYMKTFSDHANLVNLVNPGEISVIRRFLSDFNIVITDISYKRVTFETPINPYERELFLKTLAS